MTPRYTAPRDISYLTKEMTKSTMHTRFAHVWNEIVDAMREEDILSNDERLQLRYFLINLRLPAAGSNSRNTNEAVETQVASAFAWDCILPP